MIVDFILVSLLASKLKVKNVERALPLCNFPECCGVLVAADCFAVSELRLARYVKVLSWRFRRAKQFC